MEPVKPIHPMVFFLMLGGITAVIWTISYHYNRWLRRTQLCSDCWSNKPLPGSWQCASCTDRREHEAEMAALNEEEAEYQRQLVQEDIQRQQQEQEKGLWK